MSSIPHPYGAQAWADYLEERTLPVRSSVLTRFRRLLQNPDTPLNRLAPVIRSDPALSLQVTRLAQKMHSAKGSTVTGIDHAINSVGFDQLAQLSEMLQSLRVNPHSMQQKMYFRAIADSQHAASQAAELCRHRGLPFVEEVRLAALLYGFGHWLLWLHAPLHKHEYQKKVLLEKVDVALAEQDVFGCTVQALSVELARRWNLPELTLAALNHDTSPSRDDLQLLHRRAMADTRLSDEELRQINLLTQERFFPVKLGNWLALTSTRSWQSRKTLRLYDIAADFLRWPRDKLVARLHQTCAQAARQYHVPGTLSPAAQLLFLPSAGTCFGLLDIRELQQLQQHYPAPPPPAPRPPAISRVSAPPLEALSHASRSIYDQTLHQLQTGSAELTRPAQVLNLLLQGLHQGLGLARTALLLIHPQTRRLHCSCALGMDKTSALQQLDLDLEIPSLFKRLAEKPAGIWLDASRRKMLQPMLPDAFLRALQGDCLLMSLFDRNGLVAMVYADNGAGTLLSEFQYEQFRQLCAAATRALRRLQAPPL